MSNIQKYGEYSEEAAEAEREEMGKGSAEFMTLAQGDNVVRFLPPQPGKNSPFVITSQHYVTIPSKDKVVVFTCPRQMLKKPCPVCAQAERLNKGGNKADRDRAFKLFPQRKVFANVIDRNNPEAGPKVLGFGKKIHDALVVFRQNKRTGGDFTHPLRGYDIVINRVGDGLKTKYSVMADRASTPLAETPDEIDAILAVQNELERYAIVPELSDIREMLGLGDELDELDNAPVPARQLPGARVTATAAPGGARAPITGRVASRTAEEDAELEAGPGVNEDEIPF
jgi:hypothetical protein